MAPAMKLSIRWEEGEEKNHTNLKITLPKSWKEGPTLNIKKLFIEKHNERHEAANHLELHKVHLVNPKGEQLSDEDIVIKCFAPSDTVRVKPGPSPSLDQVNEARKGSKKIVNSKPNTDADDEDGHVTSAEALKKAKDAKFAFDYSKWDRLDLSDEDGDDCHPNIDLASWKRLRGRQRSERREKEDKKISKFEKKIEKYKKKVESLQTKLEKKPDNLQAKIDLKDAESSLKEYEQKLSDFLEKRKLVADDVCEVKESKGLLAQEPSQSGKGMFPQNEHKKYESYDDFQKDNKHLLKKFALMKDDLESQDFLIANPTLLCEHAEGLLLILTLDTCMKHQLTDMDPTITKTEEQKKLERAKEYNCGKQHLSIHYICELGKSMKRNPLDGVKPFYRKTGKTAEDRVEGFDEDLEKFLVRIRNRAKDKIKNNETNPLVDSSMSLVEAPEVMYQEAGLGPGGLDPNEVLPSLPEVLQQAFISQDVQKLQEAFESLPVEEGEYHLQRCIDSGLWVPATRDDEDEVEEGDADDERERDEEVVGSQSEPVVEGEGPIVDDVE